MRSFLKFRLLLWKNFLIRKGKPIVTLFEVGLPTLFSIILMTVRLRVENTPHPFPTNWDACYYQSLNPRLVPNNITKFTLAYTPYNEATNRIMDRVNKTLGIPIAPFPNEDEMVKFITLVNSTVNNSNIYLGGVVFTSEFNQVNGTVVPNKNVVYKIRLSYAPRLAKVNRKFGFQSNTEWSTNFKFPPYQIVGPRENMDRCDGQPGYEMEGFLAIQHAVDDSLMKEFLTDKAFVKYKSTNLKLKRQLYPPYVKDNYVLVLQQQFPMAIMLSLVVTVLSITRDIVLEKERKLKESMKMMGINNWLHWVAWFTKYILFLLICISIKTLFYCIVLNHEKGAVIAKTNPFIVFIYLFCYAVATITYCFTISVFFAKANTGAAIAGIMYFCMYIPYFFLQQRYTTLSFVAKLVSCLDFQVAMAYGGTLLGMFEGVGSGIQLSTLNSGVSVDDDFSMMFVLIMLIVDSVIHCLIAWYIEAVFPGDYGVPQPWYFPISRRYWGCCPSSQDYIELDDTVSIGQDPSMFEKEPNQKAGIKIRNLCKVYGSGKKKKVAVAGMTLNMYEGQITALLGHNGAGKTTTMSMLTGFYPPTSGTALINGFDIRREISEVRSSLGLCPQHDILFDNLTVEEHMIFFGLLKGVPRNQIMPQCSEMLKDMELYPKLKAMSKTLSGGMKRKLSVCIALIGNSKVVFLDEPSSGLDPNARRNIWTVLQKNRAGRTMVLSTHFMDEADLLGERIAIMADGVVKCCGSSLFLKKKYGAGYHMVVVKEPTCDVNNVVCVVKQHIPTAELESNVGAELSFILPQNCVENFEALFSNLEQRQRELGISSFGASVTTMEEVFLKVGESDDNNGKERLAQIHDNRKAILTTRESSATINGTHTTIMNKAFNKNGKSELLVKDRTNESSAKSNGINMTNRNKALSNYVNIKHIINERTEREPDNAMVDLSRSNFSSSQALNLSHRLEKNTGMKLFLQQFVAMFMKRAIHTFRNKLVTISQLVIPLFFTVMGLTVLKTLPSFIDMPLLRLVPEDFGKNYIPYSTDLFDEDMAQTFAHQFMPKSPSIPVDISKEPGFQNNSDVKDYLLQKGKEGIGTYNLRYMLAWEFNHSSVTSYFNNQGYHSIAISLATMFNGLVKYFTNSSDYNIETANHPLPRLAVNKANDEASGKDFTGFTLSFNLSFGMAFLASSFVVFLVRESTVKAKHIQFVSGVHPVNFWVSTFCWDLINYFIPCLLIIASYFAFSVKNFTEDLHWLQLILIFLLYGWAMLPFMYFFSFAFTVPATAYVWITVFNILTGVATLLVVAILSIPQIDLEDVSIVLEWIFLAVFPNFCLSQGMLQFYQNYQFRDLCQQIYANMGCSHGDCGIPCFHYNQNYFGWEKSGVGRMLVFLVIQGCVMWTLIFLSEYGILQKLQYMMFQSQKAINVSSKNYTSQMSRDSVIQEDEDVAKERERIDSTPQSTLISSEKLVLKNLTKYYDDFRAVDHLSVGIPAGECFGLLGINGAGKSSTFMMLTGDTSISSGEAFLDTYSLKTQRELARKRLGYCPQFDALIGQLTGKEILTLFARLRGIKEQDIPEAVSSLMNAMTLTQYADKQCDTYSGGNKRKLSTAIALIGDPDVVFLDEPTTGMDPVARRMLWEVLSDVRDSGRTLVLTSHSMEECEALCTRLAIMVNGQFKCLGSIQHLKNKFGEGYTFTAKVAYPPDGGPPNMAPLMEFINSTFPRSKLTDIHENMINYHITDTQLTWSQMFGEMERARERLGIEDYLVSQTSLEQVFIYFARMQEDQDKVKNIDTGCCMCCFPCTSHYDVDEPEIQRTKL
ncbi:phospholipid-transporting ATPase ABCA3-like [Physella acuta]|uniref:phospholipid-transporting ATPase ABCA3-like n=1 Tax=Physella acuta TaxID=109671 RepID=UPI0027DDE2CD|nr:phospholipid-transporting ATPase ABCA3-like [Physella acuta]